MKIFSSPTLPPPSSCAAFYPFGSKSLLKVLVLMVLALLGLWGAITAALSNTAALQRTSSQPGGPLIPLETPISNPCENRCTTLELLWTQKKDKSSWERERVIIKTASLTTVELTRFNLLNTQIKSQQPHTFQYPHRHPFWGQPPSVFNSLVSKSLLGVRT